MAGLARGIRCEIRLPELPGQSPKRIFQLSMFKSGESAEKSSKIVLPPRVCTLRSFGDDTSGFVDPSKIETSPFLETLSEHIDVSKKSQDFEIISGRLAMMVFVATVATEVVTGNSIFRKMDVEGIAETAGVCLGAAGLAAAFAWFSSARNRVGRIFTLSCHSLIDSFVDEIFDGIFYDGERPDDV